MKKKIIKVGNSYAVTIPKDFVKEPVGQYIATIQIHPSKKRLIIDFEEEKIPETVVDPEVYTVAKGLLKRYKSAFAELAKK